MADADNLVDQPPEVRTLEPGQADGLPPVSAAAERVGEFLRWYGDGILIDAEAAADAGFDNAAQCPTLYSRDLEALRQHATARAVL